MKRRGFALIELLVVIAIMALVLALAIPNYLSARERARDMRLKSEMEQLKHALRIYYNQYQQYPAAVSNKIQGCGEGGTGECPCVSGATTFDFATGNTCDTVYMKKFPADRIFGPEETGTAQYYVSGDKEKFCIVTTLESASDPDIVGSQTRCRVFCADTIPVIMSNFYITCSF